MNKQKEQLFLVIWTQALLALIGSLFFSEVMGYVPCDLCWIQRIIMYPLVVIYGVAIFKKNVDIALPGLILSGIGIFVSTYHYGIQKLSFLQEQGGTCTIVPCNVQYINYFGFITIPFLALVAFVVIFTLHIIIVIQKKKG
ncbi:MAG TPA: disulfide oxidoreductase [Bacillota bacterium]|nr:disulfide oxidoreductase [Bacillota bacterium]